MESKDLICLLAFSHFYNKNNVLIYFKVICDLVYFGSLVPDTKMAGAAVSRSAWVREFTPQAEGCVFKSQPRQT